MKFRRYLLALAALGTFAFSDPHGIGNKTNAEYETAGVKAARLINLRDIKSTLIFLASDSLQGRETTEPGQKMAAKFIAERFKSFGLKPLGDNGTYVQHFAVNVHYISDSSFSAALMPTTASRRIQATRFVFHFSKDKLSRLQRSRQNSRNQDQASPKISKNSDPLGTSLMLILHPFK